MEDALEAINQIMEVARNILPFNSNLSAGRGFPALLSWRTSVDIPSFLMFWFLGLSTQPLFFLGTIL
jgi:hypothetical protein